MIHTNILSKAAEKLQSADHAVSNLNCVKTCAWSKEKSHIGLLRTFDQCNFFIIKYFDK